MRVICVENDLSKLKGADLKKRLSKYINIDGPDNDLSIGKNYIVLAIANLHDGGVWLYLHTVDDSDYPYRYPLEMFEVVDSCLPESWCMSFIKEPARSRINLISFPEWVQDDYFYEKLVDGQVEIVTMYQHWLKRLRNER